VSTKCPGVRAVGQALVNPGAFVHRWARAPKEVAVSRALLVAALLLSPTAAAAGVAAPWQAGVDLTLVSHRPDGRPSTTSQQSSVSADGRFVAYLGTVDQIPDASIDPEGYQQVLVRDLVTGALVGASRSASGEWSNSGASTLQPQISGGGRFVVFASAATNLAPGGTPLTGIYRKDLRTGAIVVVDRAPGGAAADSSSFEPAVSADGRYVAYESYAGNLVPGDTNGVTDVFLADLRRGTTARVSVHPGGGQSAADSHHASISADGRRVAFETTEALVPSDHDDVSDVYVSDVRSGRLQRVGPGTTAQLAADGCSVVFASDAALVPGDTDGRSDVYVRDLTRRVTTRVSVAGDGTPADLPSLHASISGDGRYVAFDSAATNLVPGDGNQAWDVFVRDLRRGRTVRVDVSSNGDEAEPFSFNVDPWISANGRTVAFESTAENLVGSKTPELWFANVLAARSR